MNCEERNTMVNLETPTILPELFHLFITSEDIFNLDLHCILVVTQYSYTNLEL